MKKINCILFLLVSISSFAQNNDWVKITSMAVNGSIDTWVRKESPAEIAARPPIIHDTIYIDRFRMKVYAALAQLSRFVPHKIDTIKYDTSFFTSMGIRYTRKKYHTHYISASMAWVSGDYYYVLHKSVSWDKTDTLKRFSNFNKALVYYLNRAVHYSQVKPKYGFEAHHLYLQLDDYLIRAVDVIAEAYD